MKKKIFTLLTLLVAVCSGAWASTAVIYSEGTTANSITVNGFTIAITGNVKKNWSNGNGSITYNETSYVTLKNSNGAQNTVTCPDGTVATRVTFLVTTNNDSSTGTLSEFNGTECNDVVSSLKDYTNYTTIVKTLSTPASSFTFTFGSKQVCFIAIVEYFSTSTPQHTITAAAGEGGTVTGSGTYYEGQTVEFVATPSAGFKFVNWTNASSEEVSTSAAYTFTAGTADATYTANFATAVTYTITGAITEGQSEYGSITNAGDNIVVKDESITFVATANAGYAFVKWQKDGVDYSEDASVTVTATAAATYTAVFKKLYTVTYNIDDYKGTCPRVLNNYSAGSFDEIYANSSDKYTIPSYAHCYLYRDGYMLTGWSDGTNTYATGDEITLTSDVTLTPVWTATTQTLANTSEAVTVTWNFRFSQILFNAWQGSGFVGYYTKPQTINGESIAVPMIVNAEGGKVDNSGRTSNDNAQINKGTVFTIPAVDGMTVVLTTAGEYFTITETTVAGQTPTLGSGTSEAIYVYSGSDATVDIVINDGTYYKTIAVTYPAKTSETATITGAKYATYVPTMQVAVPEGVSAYIVSAASETSATLTEVSVIPANTPVIIYKDVDTDTEVTFEATEDDADDVSANKLTYSDKAVTADGSQYILANNESVVGFYKASGTIAARKAYLTQAAGANFISINFNGEATGISEVQSAEGRVQSGVYNIAGQRVAQPTKGLYIVNGKKVVVK